MNVIDKLNGDLSCFSLLIYIVNVLNDVIHMYIQGKLYDLRNLFSAKVHVFSLVLHSCLMSH